MQKLRCVSLAQNCHILNVYFQEGKGNVSAVDREQEY